MDGFTPELKAFVADELTINSQFKLDKPSAQLLAALRRQERRAARLQASAVALPATTEEQRRGAGLLVRAFARLKAAYHDYLLGLRQHRLTVLARADREEQEGSALIRQARPSLGSGPSGGVGGEVHEYASEMKRVMPLIGRASLFGDRFMIDANKSNSSIRKLRQDARQARDAYRRAASEYAADIQPRSDPRLKKVDGGYRRSIRLLGEAFDNYLHGLTGGGQKALIRGDDLHHRGSAAMDNANRLLVQIAANP